MHSMIFGNLFAIKTHPFGLLRWKYVKNFELIYINLSERNTIYQKKLMTYEAKKSDYKLK